MRLRSLLLFLVLALGFLLGWQTERCRRVGWAECVKMPVSDIEWSRKR